MRLTVTNSMINAGVCELAEKGNRHNAVAANWPELCRTIYSHMLAKSPRFSDDFPAEFGPASRVYVDKDQPPETEEKQADAQQGKHYTDEIVVARVAGRLARYVPQIVLIYLGLKRVVGQLTSTVERKAKADKKSVNVFGGQRGDAKCNASDGNHKVPFLENIFVFENAVHSIVSRWCVHVGIRAPAPAEVAESVPITIPVSRESAKKTPQNCNGTEAHSSGSNDTDDARPLITTKMIAAGVRVLASTSITRCANPARWPDICWLIFINMHAEAPKPGHVNVTTLPPGTRLDLDEYQPPKPKIFHGNMQTSARTA